mgnify:CR=1 FL=1
MGDLITSAKRGHKFSCVKPPAVFKDKSKYNRKKKDNNEL